MTDQEKIVNKVQNRNGDMWFTYKCKDCGEEVQISLKKILTLDDCGLVISNRCKNCREKKKEHFEKKG